MFISTTFQFSFFLLGTSRLCDKNSLLYNVKLLHPSIPEHQKAFFFFFFDKLPSILTEALNFLSLSATLPFPLDY